MTDAFRPNILRHMLEIRLFDPHLATRAEWAAVHEFRRIRDKEDNPGEPIPDDAEFELLARQGLPSHENHCWYAWLGNEVAGVLSMNFRREGTADYDSHAPYLYTWGGVRTNRRRQYIATELLHPLLKLMRERNKSIATIEASGPEGNAFLTAIGAVLKHRHIESRAPFADMDWDLLGEWYEAAIPEGAPLHWEMYVDRVPRDRIERLIPQFDALAADMPIGELDSPRLRSELSAWLAHYEELDRHGGDHTMVMLMEGETIVAICEAIWDARIPDRVYQTMTAVARPWRGRGLAKGGRFRLRAK